MRRFAATNCSLYRGSNRHLSREEEEERSAAAAAEKYVIRVGRRTQMTVRVRRLKEFVNVELIFSVQV